MLVNKIKEIVISAFLFNFFGLLSWNHWSTYIHIKPKFILLSAIHRTLLKHVLSTYNLGNEKLISFHFIEGGKNNIRNLKLTSAVFFPALAMNIALILFGFVTEGLFTSFLSFLCALPSLPIEIKCIQKHELDGKLKPSCSHSLSVYENLRRK